MKFSFHKALFPAVFILVFACPFFACSSQTTNPALSRSETFPFYIQRASMAETQLRARDISDPKVLQVMTEIPRHLFVDNSLWADAYKDFPLPIGEGQTISQPYVVAFMTQALKLTGTEEVLEIGTGSGYQAAILSPLAKEVYTMEIRPKLAQAAEQRLRTMGYENIHVKNADGYFGWPEAGPFDAIMITAAVNHVPSPLLAQLKPGGRLILPLGSTDFFQTLTLITKTNGKPVYQHLISVRFVPLVGKAEEED